ncbi:hypothetical protein CKM354_000983300 [Cercospora kikuchii]|uniref:Uncharacterized protein n=1 Tax=Cercospora kikuchii TaxID=84275 RepID=A0A9P3CLK9_9PEZI|nr:uncharacterized protein CKM354_000983300 [Cercospora kikuchii]GIZ46719.1 hypothetical protein CKM354_000983300 [Cercospora kikuchii]
MHFSALLAAGAATLAAAAPAAQQGTTTSTQPGPGAFEVSRFHYVCAIGEPQYCRWSFDLAVSGSTPNHPALPGPYYCEGSSNNTFFTPCSSVSQTQELLAYIPDDNVLQLQYTALNYNNGVTYAYFGEYQTQPNNPYQATNFTVAESAVKEY